MNWPHSKSQSLHQNMYEFLVVSGSNPKRGFEVKWRRARLEILSR